MHLLLYLTHLTLVLACARVVHKSWTERDDNMIVGRSVDFARDDDISIWAFPIGVSRNGGTRANPFPWTSRYASVTAVMFNRIFVEGVNMHGLSASALFLGASKYGKRDTRRRGMSSGVWMQYFLDMYKNVEEVAHDICADKGGKEKFQVTKESPVSGVETKIHVALSDTTGDNLIMEYVKKGKKDGKFKCYQSPDYTVVAGDTYHMARKRRPAEIWDAIEDRKTPLSPMPYQKYDRLYFFNHNIQPSGDLAGALANTMGMIRAVSTPQITIEPDVMMKNDLWPTQWRMFTNPRLGLVLYESATTPVSFTYRLSDFDLGNEGKIKVLKVKNIAWNWQNGTGDVTSEFRPLKEGELAPFSTK